MSEPEEKIILHADMDAFFASVEQRDNPTLRGKPVIVGARPDERGVVAAASYEARVYGVHSAMSSYEAGRRCPHAVYLPPNHARYEAVSREIHAIFESFTPLVESVSIDEAFLDVTGSIRLFGPAPRLAAQLKQKVRRETGLTVSVGVASNKFLAKVASGLNKPDGLTVVPRTRDGIRAFLAPLPVGRIWGVGQVTGHNLEAAGFTTIGRLQTATIERLGPIVGRHAAAHLLRLAWGMDDRDVELDREEQSLSREHTFPTDCRDPETVRQVLFELVEDVGRRLRAAGKHASLARLKLRRADFKTITRQRSFGIPVCDDMTLRGAAEGLLRAAAFEGPIRLVGFGVGRLRANPPQQLGFFDGPEASRDRREQLSRAVDRIRDRLGPEAIGRPDRPS